MTTKITLTIDKRTLKRSELYAENTCRSLSEIIENYLETLIQDRKDITEPPSPKLSKIAGIITLPDDFEEKAALNTYFEGKHLRNMFDLLGFKTLVFLEH